LAYTISATAPQPHRLSALPFRIQIPNLIPLRVYNSEFLREMRSTETVKLFARVWHRIVTWSRRTFIGDRVPLPPLPHSLVRPHPILERTSYCVVISKVHWSGDNIDSISRTTDFGYVHRQRHCRSCRTRSLRQRSPYRKSLQVYPTFPYGFI